MTVEESHPSLACEQCGKEMSIIDYMLSKYHVCHDCVVKNHKEVTGQ